MKHNPKLPNIGNIEKQLQTARRHLAIHRDELAAQIRLLELELKDAESAADSAAEQLQRLKQLIGQGVVPSSRLPKAQRDFEAAQLRVDRARTLLELFRKVDSPEESEPSEAKERDAPPSNTPAARALRDK